MEDELVSLRKSVGDSIIDAYTLYYVRFLRVDILFRVTRGSNIYKPPPSEKPSHSLDGSDIHDSVARWHCCGTQISRARSILNLYSPLALSTLL